MHNIIILIQKVWHKILLFIVAKNIICHVHVKFYVCEPNRVDTGKSPSVGQHL